MKQVSQDELQDIMSDSDTSSNKSQHHQKSQIVKDETSTTRLVATNYVQF